MEQPQKKTKTKAPIVPKVRKSKDAGKTAIIDQRNEDLNTFGGVNIHELQATEGMSINEINDRISKSKPKSAGKARKIDEATKEAYPANVEGSDEFKTANQGALNIEVPADFVFDEVKFIERWDKLKEHGVIMLENGNLSYEDEIITPRELMFSVNDVDFEKVLNNFRALEFDKLSDEAKQDMAIDIAMARITWTRTSLRGRKFARKGHVFYVARWFNGTVPLHTTKNGKIISTRQVPNKREAWFEADLSKVEKHGEITIKRHMVGGLIKQGEIAPQA